MEAFSIDCILSMWKFTPTIAYLKTAHKVTLQLYNSLTNLWDNVLWLKIDAFVRIIVHIVARQIRIKLI